MVPGKVAQHLGGGGGILAGKGQAGGADQHVDEVLVPGFGGGDAGQGHLVDLELALGGTQPAAQLLLLLHGESCVLGHEHRLRSGETLFDVGDRRDLFRSWHVTVSLRK